MDMSSLFPHDNGVGSALTSRNNAHISFKAGILHRDANSNMVTADPRKGIFQIITSPEDNLMRLQWRVRNSSSIDEDLIIFNGETEMKKVESCDASARVYVLKWKEADTRMFFWMQGKDPSEDAGLIANVNNILERGPDSQQNVDDPESGLQTTSAEAVRSVPSDTDVAMEPKDGTEPDSSATADNPLAQSSNIQTGSLTPQQLNNANGAGSASAPATTTGQITLEQMRQALGGRHAAGSTALLAAQRELVMTTPTVDELLNTDGLSSSLEDSRMQEAMTNLYQHLPEQDRSLEGLKEILRSPPFRTQAATLSHALRQSAQPSELLRSFELPLTSEAYGLKALIDALRLLQQNTQERRN